MDSTTTTLALLMLLFFLCLDCHCQPCIRHKRPSLLSDNNRDTKTSQWRCKLALDSNKDIPTFILAPIFLSHWTKLCDQMSPMPGTPVDILPADDKVAMTDFTQRSTQLWTARRHPDTPAFECQKPKNEAGRKDALFRTHGLAMLVYNLITNYTTMPPSTVTRNIGAVKLANAPTKVRLIPEIRRKWQLGHVDLGDLRKTVLDRQRKVMKGVAFQYPHERWEGWCCQRWGGGYESQEGGRYESGGYSAEERGRWTVRGTRRSRWVRWFLEKHT